MDPAETHWQGPRTAAAASQHKGGCGAARLRSQWSRDRAVEAREHARRAVDPAEAHWQGPRTAAAASLQHGGSAGQGEVARSRGQNSGCAGCTSSKDLAVELASVQGGPLRTVGPRRGTSPCRDEVQGSAGCAAPKDLVWFRPRACREAEHKRRREHTLAEQWIPRTRIGKGPGQPPQLACRGRLQGRATQGQDRALEARLAQQQRPGCWTWQACSGSRGDTLARAHKIAAAMLACTGRLRGSSDSGRLESGQSTRGEGTRSQSSGSRGDALARAQDSRRS